MVKTGTYIPGDLFLPAPDNDKEVELYNVLQDYVKSLAQSLEFVSDDGEKVKAEDDDDETPGYLEDKTDDVTIQVTNNYLTVFGVKDADGDTKIQVEESADEDIIRFDTGDTQGGSTGERVTMDVNGLAITSELKVTLDGRGGNTYIKYNDTSKYTELWTEGTKRIEY